MKRFVLAILIVLGSSGYYFSHKKIAFADEKKQDHSRPASEAVKNTADVHYSAEYCQECHEQTPADGDKFLRYSGNFKQLCRCHHKVAGRDLHPVGLEPSEEIKVRIPANFPLLNGKIACSTCHDIVVQCRDLKTEDTFTRKQMFLRGAPYRKQTKICFKCHDQRKFQRYNPHQQLNENGDIIALKCLYCHVEKPDEKKAGFDDVILIGDLEILCDRCHNKAGEQSLHSRHLRRPSAKILARIQQMEVEFGVALPLNEGKITCATCHNPHQEGVIPAERAGAKGSGDDHRRRLTRNMCMQCHQMSLKINSYK